MKTDIPDLTNLMEWNRFADEKKTIIEALTILNNRHRQAISELNQRLIERQESFQAQLIRIEDGWREKLREANINAQIWSDQSAEAIRQVGASDTLNRELLSQIVALREALEDVRMMSDELRSIARQKLSSELEGEEAESADFEDGYNHCVKTAREAVAAFEKLLP